MITFVVVAALMALATLGLLTRPLWRRRAPPEGDTSAPSQARAPSTMIAALTGFVAAVVLAGYALIGAPVALDPGAHAARDNQQITAAQVDAMVAKLAARLKEQPNDVEGWTMLGRSYAVLGKHDQASAAFKQALVLKPNDPVLLADYADTLAASKGGNLDGEPSALLAQALQGDPNNQKALALAGFAAFNRDDYPMALRHWEKLTQLGPDSDFARMVQGGIDEAKRRMAAASAPAGGPRVAAAAASAAPAARAGAVTVSGTVRLSPALAGKAAPDDTVFVYARAAQGARVPLAILRKQVKDLPLQFALDDSMAMSPAAKLSGASEVVVSARISKSGQAMPQPGDLQGQSGTVVPGASGLVIEIGQVVGN